MTSRKGASTRRRLVECARDLVAEGGLAALSHRAVEQRAGVSHGVTTYHFATQESLVAALLEFLGDELIEWQEAAHATGGATREQRARAVVAGLTSHRESTLARYELYLYAARRPALAPLVAAARRRHVEIEARAFGRLGAKDPRLAANRYLSAVEGLVIYQLGVPEPDFERWAPSYLLTVMDALVAFDAPVR
jgi:AcrR family transcriptional regulator